jgi:hypothetical protein
LRCDAPVSPAAETRVLSSLGCKFLSDQKLVEQLQPGNADALTYLFERHSSQLFGIARRILSQLGAKVFLANARIAPNYKAPAGMQKRFLERAMSEGIPLNEPKSNFSLPMLLA